MGLAAHSEYLWRQPKFVSGASALISYCLSSSSL
jgi:hypothetical protein